VRRAAPAARAARVAAGRRRGRPAATRTRAPRRPCCCSCRRESSSLPSLSSAEPSALASSSAPRAASRAATAAAASPPLSTPPPSVKGSCRGTTGESGVVAVVLMGEVLAVGGAERRSERAEASACAPDLFRHHLGQQPPHFLQRELEGKRDGLRRPALASSRGGARGRG